MRVQAMRLAAAYRAGFKRQAARVLETIRHPSLYVFLNDCGDAFPEIKKHTGQSHVPGSAFFLQLNDEAIPPIDKSIRGVKADIQRNEGRLNVKRLNIYIITLTRGEKRFIESAVEKLRDIFTEDFSILPVSLCILLSESNEGDDYEKRTADSYRFLRDIGQYQKNTPLVDRIYVLSDRNEHDVVSEINKFNNYRLITRLHFLDHAESRFGEVLKAKSLEAGGKAFFSTAGFASLDKPHEEIYCAVFRHIHAYLENELKKTMETPEPGSYASIHNLLESLGFNANMPERDITSDMQSVAVRRINLRRLKGCTLKEAENILYGEGAARFYHTNYAPNEPFSVAEAFNKAAENFGFTGINPEAFNEILAELSRQKETYQQEMELLYQTLCKTGIFQGLDSVIKMLSKAYTLRYKKDWLEYIYRSILNIKNGIDVFFRYSRRFKKALAEAGKEWSQTGNENGKHIDTYYIPVTDKILSELNGRFGSGFILTENFIGPVIKMPENPESEPDLSYLAEKLDAFITKHILTHETMQLTFEDDLQKRSLIKPMGYDSGFVHVEEFYRRLLSEAGNSAALAVSLQRYDGLVQEKYYFCDTNGVLAQYAKQLSKSNNEAVFFLEETAGSSIIRLAGGFTIEDLTRYRAMKQFYESAEKNHD